MTFGAFPALPELVSLLPWRGHQSERKIDMWTWICCYLTGHDYSVACVNGAMFLRCVACGRRSQGWVVHAEHGHAHRSAL